MTVILKNEWSADAGKKAADEAVKRVGGNMDPDWRVAALSVIRYICGKIPAFTTDDVWHELQLRHADVPHEPRAMGAIMRIAVKDGLCAATDVYKMSSRAACHRRPLRAWRSLLFFT